MSQIRSKRNQKAVCVPTESQTEFTISFNLYTDAVQLKGLYHVKCTRLCYIRELVIEMFALIVFHCTLSLKSM